MPPANGDAARRKLINHVIGEPADGDLEAVLATTFDLDADFFETDFLPSVLGMKAWSDKNWSSRIALEKKLALMESATVWMEAERFLGRPRSLRLEVVPFKLPQRKLHAKVTVLVYKKSVRLLVGSANLTERGYRRNREVAVSLAANEKHQEAAGLILAALDGLPRVLGDAWTESAEKARNLAVSRLAAWNTEAQDAREWFVWSGLDKPLWQTFLRHWPKDEPIRRISIVSPFWAEDPTGDFLAPFLTLLRETHQLVQGATLRLFTDALQVTPNLFKPVLPAAYGAFDFAALGVEATAHAVDPNVPKDEHDFGEDLLAKRSLHAKVVFLEGANVSLAYVGSANFTRKGWGLGIAPSQTNIEAGLVLLREGKSRGQLAELIPSPIGEPVVLDCEQTLALAEPEPMAASRPWPLFLRSVSLAPGTRSRNVLELLLRFWPERVGGEWALSVQAPGEEGVEIELHRQPAGSTQIDEVRVAISSEQLHALMLSQVARVRWWNSEEPAHFPVNVEPAARDSLPISPGNPRLEEHHLIAYYQGRILWEDLFPDPFDAANIQRLEELSSIKAGVDTSGIQSYQIREFVEALHGIAHDLKQCCFSEPSMRLTLHGPVSPVSLARSVVEAVRQKRRTPIGAGFQLVEILACLDMARHVDVEEKLQAQWKKALLEATAEVEMMLNELRNQHEKDFLLDVAFADYEQAVRVHAEVPAP